MGGLELIEEHGRALRVSHRGTELMRYVYQPWEAQLESPRPYLHPVRTLGGDLVTLYRPHDHVWHKGIAWSLPNVGPANFWGGPTYLRRNGVHGYRQLANNGAMRHRDFEWVQVADNAVSIVQNLDWITERGETWFTERRALTVHVDTAVNAWILSFATRFTNVSGTSVVFGSPTTEGRPNAGYGGLFWRGPRSFTGGRVHAPGVSGGDELMGITAPWLGFCGRHDEHGRASTLVFVDAPDNPGHPVKWFVRSSPFACVCPAPFFDTEIPAAPSATLSYRYAVVIADFGREPDELSHLASAGLTVLNGLTAGRTRPG